ncbi:MAG TPA: tetratricopeptide repeat protein [Ignavibacteriaceae bacterium]|nr:tetratricopeptide repeat protein [Ignavibacteriaceae bacterium]
MLHLKLIISSCLLLVLFFLSGCEEQHDDEITKIDKLINEIELEDTNSPLIEAKIDSLFSLIKREKNDKALAKAYSLRGNYYYSKREYNTAYTNYQTAVNISDNLNDPVQLGIDYDNLARTYNRLKNRDSSVIFFKKSAEVRSILNDSSGVAAAYNNTGYIFWQQSRFDSAIFYFEKALKIREKLPDKENLATTLNNIGTVYYQWSIYDKALEYYVPALNLNKELNMLGNVALILTNIGIVYKETAQIPKAIEYYHESLNYATITNNLESMGYAYNSLGAAFLEINDDSCVYYFSRSLEVYKQIYSVGGVIISLKGLGENYLRKNNLIEARKYFNEILEIATSENIQLRIAEANKYLGIINKAEGNLSAARDHYEKCIEVSKKINVKSFMRDAYKDLSEVYESLGNTNLALNTLKEFNKYKSEIDNEDVQRRLDNLKNKFEFERYQRMLENQKFENEQQKVFLYFLITGLVFLTITAFILYYLNSKRKKANRLLNEKNKLIEGQSVELEKINNELSEINKSKDKLFSIISHDLKNPFFALISLSEILKNDFNELPDKEKMEYISHIHEASTKTYELLENLLNLSASQTGKISSKPVSINLERIINKAKELYSGQLKKKEILLLNSIHPGISIYADLQMMEVVFRNLINNAIKYTRKNGQIEIKAEQINNKVMISISDNGVGMDDFTKENIFNINTVHSSKGTEGEKGTGLGLGLCKEFITKNNGSISLESVMDRGSTFTVILPATETV